MSHTSFSQAFQSPSPGVTPNFFISSSMSQFSSTSWNVDASSDGFDACVTAVLAGELG